MLQALRRLGELVPVIRGLVLVAWVRGLVFFFFSAAIIGELIFMIAFVMVCYLIISSRPV